MPETFTDSLFLELEKFAELLPRLIFGILVIVLFYGIGKLISNAYDKILSRTTFGETSLHYFQKLIVGIFFFI